MSLFSNFGYTAVINTLIKTEKCVSSLSASSLSTRLFISSGVADFGPEKITYLGVGHPFINMILLWKTDHLPKLLHILRLRINFWLFVVRRVKMIGPITTAVFHPSDVTSGRHLGWPHIRSAILDDFISGRPFCMTSYPVGHVGWRNLCSAILEWWHSAWLFTKFGRPIVFQLLHSWKWREHLHFNIYLVFGKMAGKSRITFIIVIRFVPGGSLMRQNNKMTCANSEDLDQPGHSENGGKI